MSYYKFRPNDLFVNTIEAYPDVKFYIHSGSIFINDETYISGSRDGIAKNVGITGVPKSFISLYEYNINRPTSQNIYPFLVKGSSKSSFKRISNADWNTQYNYDGNIIASTYNLSASVTRHHTWNSTDTDYKRLRALTNTINHYRYLSNVYDFDTYYKDKESQYDFYPFNILWHNN